MEQVRSISVPGAAALLLVFSKSSQLAAGATLGLYADAYATEQFRLYAGSKSSGGLRELLPHTCAGSHCVVRLEFRSTEPSTSNYTV